MNSQTIKVLVDRGLALVAKKKEIDRELKEIEAQLRKAGLEGDHQELKDAAREGRQFLAQGTVGIVPIIFSADLLVKSFAPDSKEHTRIGDAAGEMLGRFYVLTPTYQSAIKDGKEFRARADDLLGKEAPAFITACLQRGKGGVPKSTVKTEWEKALGTAGEAAVTESGEE